MADNDNIEVLRGKLDSLNEGDRRFAESLISQFDRKGRLSGRQWPWVDKLIEKADAPAPEPQTTTVSGGVRALYDFFHGAKQHLKYPKIVLAVATVLDGEERREETKIYMSGAKSRVPNAINIVLPDRDNGYGRNTWLGRIIETGEWTLPRQLPEDFATFEAVITRLAEKPHEVAAEHGALTGHCCFCNRALTDDRSTAVGYGPVCADKWGLKAEWKRAASVLDNPPETVKRPRRTRVRKKAAA